MLLTDCILSCVFSDKLDTCDLLFDQSVNLFFTITIMDGFYFLRKRKHLCPEMHAMRQKWQIWRKSSTINNVGKISDFGDILPISSN